MLALLALAVAQPPAPAQPAPGTQVGPPALIFLGVTGGKVVRTTTKMMQETQNQTVMVPVTVTEDGKAVTKMKPEMRQVTVTVGKPVTEPLDPRTTSFRTVGGEPLTYEQAAARLAKPLVCLLVTGEPAAGDPYLTVFKPDVLLVKVPQQQSGLPLTLPATPVPPAPVKN